MKGIRRQGRVRLAVQLASAALLNGYAAGFAGGKIFTGTGKAFCVPVLNCYACPGALGSCPVGSLQNVLGGARHRFSFYVLGLLTVFGIALGRLWCGFVCPFGLVQDLIGMIPAPRVKVPGKIDKPARYVKYIVLAVFVILLPLLAKNPYGIAESYLCKYICPAGTLQGGIPLMLTNRALRALAGALFTWKVLVLVVILAASAFIPRFFCRYLCPLGAFYGLFNRFSFYQVRLDRDRCTGCMTCRKVCPMDAVTLSADEGKARISGAECIRCGRCRTVCPEGAVISGSGSAGEKMLPEQHR